MSPVVSFTPPASLGPVPYDDIAYVSRQTLPELGFTHGGMGRYFLETEPERSSIPPPPIWLARPEIGFSLTSHTCYHTPVARLLAHTLIRRLQPGRSHAEDFTLLLQEAIINAVVHGNLVIENTYRTASELSQFFQQINARIAQPHFARMRVYVHAWQKRERLVVCVTQSGIGRLATLTPPSAPDAPHGHGLPLMRALAYSLAIRDKGRTLEITW